MGILTFCFKNDIVQKRDLPFFTTTNKHKAYEKTNYVRMGASGAFCIERLSPTAARRQLPGGHS